MAVLKVKVPWTKTNNLLAKSYDSEKHVELVI